MTERKPPGTSWESYVDRQIDAGRAQGLFDDLPGTGKPLDGLDQPHDELWWIRAKLKAEDLAALPPSLELRRDVDDAVQQARDASSEATVRAILEPINERIRRANARGITGPPVTLVVIDVEAFVARWRAEHPHLAAATGAEGLTDANPAGTRSPRSRWWRRRDRPTRASGTG